MELASKLYNERFIKILGLILLFIGLVGLFYGPMEIYCFYMFSEGGKFYYEGFQIGSLFFAYLVIQNSAYYIIAFLLIPIGLGLFKLKNWGLKLSLNLLYIWIILGISILSGFILSVPQLIQKLNLSTLVLITLLLVLTGIVIPFILIKIFNSKSFQLVFKPKNSNWIDKVPQIILLICSLNVLFILLLHSCALFQFIFPFFGKIILHREAVLYLTSAIFILAILTYGIWIKHILAFWGLLIYYTAMIISIILTFNQYTLPDIINILKLSSYEQTQIIPLITIFLNANLASILVTFLFIVLFLCIYFRKKLIKNNIKTLI